MVRCDMARYTGISLEIWYQKTWHLVHRDHDTLSPPFPHSPIPLPCTPVLLREAEKPRPPPPPPPPPPLFPSSTFPLPPSAFHIPRSTFHLPPFIFPSSPQSPYKQLSLHQSQTREGRKTTREDGRRRQAKETRTKKKQKRSGYKILLVANRLRPAPRLASPRSVVWRGLRCVVWPALVWGGL